MVVVRAETESTPHILRTCGTSASQQLDHRCWPYEYANSIRTHARGSGIHTLVHAHQNTHQMRWHIRQIDAASLLMAGSSRKMCSQKARRCHRRMCWHGGTRQSGAKGEANCTHRLVPKQRDGAACSFPGRCACRATWVCLELQHGRGGVLPVCLTCSS